MAINNKCVACRATSYFITKTHAHVEIIYFSTWEVWGHRPSAFQVLMMHRVGKCVISTWGWVPAFILWPVKIIKAAMQNSHISTHPFSSWIVSWAWDNVTRTYYHDLEWHEKTYSYCRGSCIISFHSCIKFCMFFPPTAWRTPKALYASDNAL